MAKRHTQLDIRPSLVDRLVAEPGSGSEARRAWTVREIKNGVARDLEWLFNSYRMEPPGLQRLKEASRSILGYGIPDLSSYSWSTKADADEIAKLLEEAIRRFEPRLLPHSVHVVPLRSQGLDDFRLRFRIEAILHVEPITEPVAYDTDFESATLSATVRRAA